MNDCKHKVCIKVPKVYDWVQRHIELPLIQFDGEDLDDLFEKLNNDSDTEVCRFLENQPGFQVRCNIIEDSVICEEVGKHPAREELSVTLDTGETSTLQKVKVLVKGLVKIIILDAQGNILLVSDEIPFTTTQTFLLCAPIGTDLHCKVTYLQCEAAIVCKGDFEQLVISFSLCLDVQMENDIKLAVKAAICKPRQELPFSEIVCPVNIYPPQCPEIFPGER